MVFPSKRSTNTTDFGTSAKYGGGDMNAICDYVAPLLDNLHTPFTYNIYKIGSTYYARDKYGNITSNANPATLIQSVLTAMTNGGSIFIDVGDSTSYDIDTEINIPSNAKQYKIISDGALLKRTANITQMFDCNTNTGSILFQGLSFDGNTATSAAANKAIGGGANNITVRECKFDGFNTQHPLGIASSNNVNLTQNMIGDCTGFGSEGACTNLWITRNYFFEATTDYAIVAAGNIVKNDNVWVTDNTLPFGSTGAGGGIDVVAKKSFITRNYINSPYQHGIYVHDNNLLGGSDEVEYCEITDNIIEGRVNTSGYSIQIEQPNDATKAQVQIKGNELEYGLAFTFVNNAIVHSNMFWGTSSYVYVITGSKHDYYNNQFIGQYGFALEASFLLTNSIIKDNRFDTTVAPFLSALLPSSSVVKYNKGFVTENSGTATVASGQTTIAVNHGLGITPDINNIHVTPKNSMGSATKFFVSTVTSTQFTINVNVDPGATTAIFAWTIV